MRDSPQRTSVQVTNPDTATHILRFTVHLGADDTLRLLLQAVFNQAVVSETPTLVAAAERLGVGLPAREG